MAALTTDAEYIAGVATKAIWVTRLTKEMGNELPVVEQVMDNKAAMQRHPFSGLVHSAGELLHTP